MSELKTAVDIGNLDVIAVAETWVTPKVFDNEVPLVSFWFSMVDRLKGREGGVIMYTKRTKQAVETVAHDLGTCALVRCRLKCKRQDIELVVVYHSTECVVNDCGV